MAKSKKPSTPKKSTLQSRQRQAGGEGSREEIALPTDEREILKHYRTFLRTNEPQCRDAWNKAQENQRFAGGGKAQWNEQAYNARESSGRPTFSLNDCELATRAVTGRELTARFEPAYLARSPDDGPRVAAYREVARYIRSTARADNAETHAFRDLTIDNVSVLELYQSFDGDEPFGRTVVEHNPLWEHVWDVSAREVCFTDRAADARGFWISVDDFLMLFPGERDKINDRLGQNKNWVSEVSTTSAQNSWSAYAQSGQYIRREQREIFLVSYHWRQREAAWMATVPAGMEPHPVGPEAWGGMCQVLGIDPEGIVPLDDVWAQIKPMLDQAAAAGAVDAALVQLARPRQIKMNEAQWEKFKVDFATATQREPDALTPEDGVYRWAYHEAMIVGDSVVKTKRLPFRSFPRVYMTGVPITLQSGTILTSVVESMKEPQRFKNFVTSLMSSHLQRSQKTGMIFKPGTFADENDLESRTAEPFWLLKTQPGADLDSGYRIVEGSGFPQGLDKFLEMADTAAWRPTGMNPNTLGNLQDPRRVSGTVFQALGDAVMTVLSWEFNSLSTMRQIMGGLYLDFVKEYYNPEVLADIVGPERAHAIPGRSTWDYSFAFDCIINEVPVSKSEKEASWDMTSRQGSLEKWVQMQIAPPWLIPVMMPDSWVPEEYKKKWLAWLTAKGMGPDSPPAPPPAQPGQDPNQPQQPPGGQPPAGG